MFQLDEELDMIARCRVLILVVGIVASVILPNADAQRPDPNSPRYKGVIALSDFLASNGEEALRQFVNEKVSKELLSSMGQERLSSELTRLRSKFAGARRSGASREGPLSARIEFSNGNSISFEMEADPPHRFVRIGSIGGDGSSDDAVDATPPKSKGVTSFEQLDEQLQAEAAAETFSGVLLVAKAGEPVFHEAYGFADKEAGVANRKDTKFNLGSINKLFTKVAAYQLLTTGKLALDDTIGRYLPQFPPSVANRVTVRHLLEHRFGWGAYWDNPTWNARRTELRSLDDYMAFIKDIPLEFEPGSRKQYSNTGYEVLGAIIQKASGQSYYDYMREHVYKPAGMMDTDAYERDGKTPNLAVGYAGGGYSEDNSTMLAVKGTAAGGGFSTAADLMRFAKALDQGMLVPKKYAGRLRRGGFAGGGPGVNAALELNVAGGHTVVVLSNFDPPTASRIAQEINGMLRGRIAAETGARRYRIGVGLAPHEDGIAVSVLVPGGPGEKGGLKPDDFILALNGKPIADDPIGHFDTLLTKSDPIRLKVRRGTELTSITITPEPMNAGGQE
jgi:CubicO group peptidase (beta-lactamase class C family)